MGVLPIGFFSPLPLAMMIPFMATQSLAMGEAFGKSFQYGKRKISSMTNEEFNKYNFADMMDEQTANMRTIIPKLSEQMIMSYDLQVHIFDQMIKLIPAFFTSLMGVLQPLSDEFKNFGTTPFNEQIPNPNIPTPALYQGSPVPPPTLIEHVKPKFEDIVTYSLRLNKMSLQQLSNEYRNRKSLDIAKQNVVTILYRKRLQTKHKEGDKKVTKIPVIGKPVPQTTRDRLLNEPNAVTSLIEYQNRQRTFFNDYNNWNMKLNRGGNKFSKKKYLDARNGVKKDYYKWLSQQRNSRIAIVKLTALKAWKLRLLK